MTFLLLLLLALLLHHPPHISAAKSPSLLPKESLPTKSGYLPINPTTNSAIFYTFYEAQQQPNDSISLSKTPLLIWLQGGPGCSSMLGNFYELGPWRVSRKVPRVALEPNSGSWNRLFGLLFLDNPIGVGFSIAETPEEIPRDQHGVAKHLFAAVTSFVGLDPSFKTRPIYFTGESYAGKYLPAIGYYILKKNAQLPPSEQGHCIGAVDETHVMVRCRKKQEEKKFYGRKGYATQNIMAMCDFDLTFVFVSAGWEGTYHDYSVFKRCVLNPYYCFPQPEAGKYYLVDAGYPNRPGFLAPYKGHRYHQADFRRGRRRPTNDREHFNRAHSSLRSCVERTFGVWKGRFGFLYNMPWYSLSKQVNLVLASMAIHNYIRRDRTVVDELFTSVSAQAEYAFEDLEDADPEQQDR